MLLKHFSSVAVELCLILFLKAQVVLIFGILHIFTSLIVPLFTLELFPSHLLAHHYSLENVDWFLKGNTKPHLELPANIGLDEDVFKTNILALLLRLQKTSSRRLDQDQYIRLGHTSSRRLQDLLKTSSRHFAKMSSKRLQDLFKTSCKNVFNTSSKCLAKMSWRIIKLYCSC